MSADNIVASLFVILLHLAFIIIIIILSVLSVNETNEQQEKKNVLDFISLERKNCEYLIFNYE